MINKIVTEERVQATVGCLVRLGVYGIVAGIGWKVTNDIAENEINKNKEINELKMEVNDLKSEIVRSKIDKIKNDQSK